jgi:hypothetical protein
LRNQLVATEERNDFGAFEDEISDR